MYRPGDVFGVVMETCVVTGIFHGPQLAREAMRSLRAARFPPAKVSVFGPESEEFRALRSEMAGGQFGRLIFIYGLLGMMLGILFAFHATLSSAADSLAVRLGPFYTLLLGAILGTMTGTLTGVAIHCDSASSNARVQTVRTNGKGVTISLRVDGAFEQQWAESLLKRGGATEIRTTKTMPGTGSPRSLSKTERAS